MLHQVQHALLPFESLAAVLAAWAEISEELADPVREREPQLTEFFP